VAPTPPPHPVEPELVREAEPAAAEEHAAAATAAPQAATAVQPAPPLSDEHDEQEEYEAPAFDPRVFTRSRPERSGGDGRRTIIVAVAGIVALVIAAVGVVMTMGGHSGPSTVTFSQPGAPFSFEHPASFADLGPRLHTSASRAASATAQAAVGPGGKNVILVQSYRMPFTVRPDGSATNAAGLQLTPQTIENSVDASVAQVARHAGLAPSAAEQQGALGSLVARQYDFTGSGGLLTRMYVAFQGSTEFFVQCQWTPDGAKVMPQACDAVATTFKPV
jgi:hypothetical protein